MSAGMPAISAAEFVQRFAKGAGLSTGDLGSARGLLTDHHANVLDRSGAPIAGLYAAGNEMNSIMHGTYPGPGITLGPALTFGYIAARHAAAEAAR